MNEIKTGDNLEIKGIKELPYQKIKPENGMNAEKAKNYWDKMFDSEQSPIDNSEVKEYTTLKERIDQTPREDSENGEWTDGRGQSKFIPYSEDMKTELAKYGQDGVEYEGGKPDFHPYSVATVEIDMTSVRESKKTDEGRIVGNFEKADIACAKQWNDSAREGRTDWTYKDVEKWRHENKYSWHECSDMKTCELVPQIIHDYFSHPGGVMECKRRDCYEAYGGGFDE